MIHHFVRLGHDVHIVAPYDAKADSGLPESVKVHPWALSRSGANPIRELGSLLSLWKTLRRMKPDLVFSYTIKPNSYAPPICTLLHIPVVAIVTGLGYAFSNRGASAFLGRWMLRSGLRQATQVLALNQDDKAFLGGAADSLPGEGVDTTYYSPGQGPAPHPVTFTLIARLLRDKGVYEFMEAAAIVAARSSDVHFILVGPHDTGNPAAVDMAHIRAAVDLGILSYRGAQSDIRPVIEASHCIVLPSYHEGLPRVLLEAAAMERPVIATDIPGCRDIIVPGETGLLCAPRDVESLVQAIQAFLDMPPQDRHEMGRKGRDRVVASFSDAAVIAKYDHIMQALISP
ncbi:MAG: glycosyltransferase family 4 protein [Pseudomonadota bacterium]